MIWSAAVGPEAVDQLFDTLQFRVLRERLFRPVGVDPEEPPGVEVPARVLGPAKVTHWFEDNCSGPAQLWADTRTVPGGASVS